MKYCSNCGSSQIIEKVPPGDTFPRKVCLDCGSIFYENPKIIVGTIPYYKDQVLLIKRSIEPRKGYWSFPCGFMEKGESVEEGAIRETIEEAKAKVEISRLFSIYSIPRVDQVYIVFLAKLKSLDFSPGEESLEAKLFSIEKIPWEDLAFPAISFSLKKYVENYPSFKEVYLGSYLDKKPPWEKNKNP